MATRNAFDGKRRAGNPHVWFDEGEVSQAATSRRWGPLCSFRHGLALAMVTFAAATAPAGEYYVDCNMSDYTGHDGTTPAKAYETIQQAVSCPNGSVIHVAPGRYDKGLGRDATYDENGNRTGGHWWLKSRVSITDKDLTFIADKGAGRTFIVGEGGTAAVAESNHALIAMRLAGSAFVIAVAEELFFRKWLVDFAGFWWMVALFAVEHDRWLVGAIAGVAYGLLARRRGLGAAVVAHVVTNLVLGLWVLHSGQWQFW